MLAGLKVDETAAVTGAWRVAGMDVKKAVVSAAKWVFSKVYSTAAKLGSEKVVKLDQLLGCELVGLTDD